MHSHTSLQHLIKKAEEIGQRKEKKDVRPDWLTRFIQNTAELFEPATDAARVGYDCRYEIDQWSVMFYLGDAEIFGGMHDGKRARIAFDFDLNELLNRFDVVDSLRYRALPKDPLQVSPRECTLIEISGILKQEEETVQQLTVGILSHPPLEAGPGVRILPNGEIEPV